MQLEVKAFRILTSIMEYTKKLIIKFKIIRITHKEIINSNNRLNNNHFKEIKIEVKQ